MAAVRPHPKDTPSTVDFSVEGMTCGSCAVRVQRVLAKTDGVADAEVNLATGRAHLTLQRPLPTAELQARVARIGYGLTPWPRRPAAAMTRRSGRAGPGGAGRGWSLRLRCSRPRPCWPAPP
jgi:copper chaperone CopZ